MIFVLDKASQLLYDTGHSALRTGPHILLGPWESSPSWSDLPSPPKASHCLVCRDRGLPDPDPLTGMEGQRLAGDFLHKAVLSVSLSMSSRIWPGTSLLAKSECISGKMFRSDSETLELVSVTILEAVGTEGVRPPSPMWVPGGFGGGGTLGRLRGLGTGRGLGRVPCSCVISLWDEFCLAGGGVLGGVGV